MAMPAIQKNMAFVKEQLTAVLGNSSVVVKFVCTAVFLCYFLSFSEGAIWALTVIPGNVLPPNFWFWTVFTHSFIERHVWIVIVDIAVVVLYGKLLEPLWGALEMLIFYLVVNLSVAVLSTLTYMCIYFVTNNTDYLFDTYVHGLAGYLAGFAVAVKQVMPDHVLVASPFGKLRNKHIPLLLLTTAIVVRLIGGVDGPFPIMFGYGLMISWVYLRFYQKHSNGNRGDLADTFTFASFFPVTLQPPVIILSNTVFALLVKIRVCKKPQRRYDVSSPTTITVSLPGTDPLDAERRRQLALKALNERLSKVSDPSDQASWPTMEGVEAGDSQPATPDSLSATTPLLEVKSESPEGDKRHEHKRTESSGSAHKLPVPDFKENAKMIEDS